MTKFARIIDSTAVEVFEPIKGFELADCFHPDAAALFELVPDAVVVGSLVDGKGKWTIAEPSPPPAPVETIELLQVSPVEFKLLFTSAERVAIKLARAADPILDDFFEIVEDPRLTLVNLRLRSTQEAIGYLQAKNYITADRKTEILTGQIL